MGTRSIIAKSQMSGSFIAIYCHWDGYPDCNGRILVNHWTNQKDIDELFSLGHLSALGHNIRTCSAFGNKEKENRAEVLGNIPIASIIEKFSIGGIEYLYVWNYDNTWTCYNSLMEVIDLSGFVMRGPVP